VFAGVGCPAQNLENLKNGIFRPDVSVKAKKRRASKINTLIKYRNEVEMEDVQEDLVTHEDIIVAEIPVTGYEVYKQVRTEAKLQDLCLELCDAFDKRVKPGELMEKAVDIFHKDDGSWFVLRSEADPADMSDEEKRVEEENKEENLNQAQQKMKSLLDAWDQPVALSYDLESVTEGFLLFMYFKKKLYRKQSDGPVVLEDLYKSFVERTHDMDISESFKDMFERIQIKTFSEAVCETIGSVMSIAKGKGRNCDPVQFSEEVTLSYNLPPLHILAQSFIPEIVSELSASKDYFRKGNEKSASIINRLVSSSLSASIFNFRKGEEERSKLPSDSFC
jgi:hypothetical protein